MVGNVTNAKNAQEHHDFVLHEIAAEAQDGSCEGVLNIIKRKQSCTIRIYSDIAKTRM